MLPLTTREERNTAFSLLVSYMERVGDIQSRSLLDSVLEQCAIEPNSTAHMLTWEEITALADEGVAVGPHTRNHTILAQLTPERARNEVVWSWADLQARIARPLPIFCYPNGKPHAINRAGVHAVERSGLAGAFTMVAGLNVVGNTNPYLMYRVGAVAGESLRRFSLKMTLAGRVYRKLKGIARGRMEAFSV